MTPKPSARRQHDTDAEEEATLPGRRHQRARAKARVRRAPAGASRQVMEGKPRRLGKSAGKRFSGSCWDCGYVGHKANECAQSSANMG